MSATINLFWTSGFVEQLEERRYSRSTGSLSKALFPGNGTEYEVVQARPFSGHWTLEGPQGVVTKAQKTSAFTRTFELESDSGLTTLQARSVFTRAFELLQAGNSVGTIVPMHAFTPPSDHSVHGSGR